MQYAQDNGERLPRAWYGKDAGPSDAKTNSKWMDAILPYVGNESLFVCPSDRVNHVYHIRDGTHYGSYVYNNAYYAPGDKYAPPANATLAELQDPGFTVMQTVYTGLTIEAD